MFYFRRRGLRSYRSVLTLLFFIILFPLVFLFVSDRYLTAPPIYEGYKEQLKRANSVSNGFIYLEVAETLSKRLFDENFIPREVKVFPERKEAVRIQQRIGMWITASEYLYFLYELVRSDGLYQELNDRGEEWKHSFMSSTLEIFQNVHLANSKEYFIPYIRGKTEKMYMELYPAHLMVVAFIATYMWIRQGDYDSALYWMSELGLLYERMYDVSINLSFPLFCNYYLNPIVSIRGLPEYFYEEVLCLLDRMRKKLERSTFDGFYRSSLLYVEHSFAEVGKEEYKSRQIWDEITRYTTAFFTYNALSRYLQQKGELINSVVWDDVEDAYYYGKGKLHPLVMEMKGKFSNRSRLGEDVWLFISGEMWRKMLFARSAARCSIYTSILTVELEKHRWKEGRYPEGIEEVLANWFNRDEKDWISKFIEVYLSSNQYEIIFYPLPIDGLDNVSVPVSMRKMYRIKGSENRLIE